MRKQYTPAQKAQIVLEVLKEEKTITQIASEHGVHPSQLCRWRDKAVQNLASLFRDASEGAQAKTVADEAEIEKLYAEIGRLTTQLNWLKKTGGQHEWTGANGHDRTPSCGTAGGPTSRALELESLEPVASNTVLV